MTAQVYVKFDKIREYEYHVPRSHEPADARRWLDEQFVELGAEPLRIGGKILLADKVLAVASAAGPERFAADEAWAKTFASAACAALQRNVLKIDVENAAIGY